MQKNNKTNLILFCVGILLATALYVLNQHQKKQDYIFLPLDVSKIEHIVIDQLRTVELRKVNDAWTMVTPQQGNIDHKIMKKVFEILGAPMGDKFPVSEVNLEELSLQPPNLRVLLDGEAMEFGSLAATKQMHYVLFKDHVYLASPFLQVRFSQSPEQLLKQPETQQDHSKDLHNRDEH